MTVVNFRKAFIEVIVAFYENPNAFILCADGETETYRLAAYEVIHLQINKSKYRTGTMLCVDNVLCPRVVHVQRVLV